MKLGLGLYRHQLDDEHFRFARQAGCSDVVVHLVDYFRSPHNDSGDQPVGDEGGWGLAGGSDELWTATALTDLRHRIEAHGLRLAAIENFDPAHWHDVLLDGPKKAEQLEFLKGIIRNLGAAGIPVMGYNFSIAGVAGRVKGRYARGEAESVGMEGPLDTPIPKGMVWNMVYDPAAGPGTIEPATHEQLWQRLQDFLEALLPVAEEAGVVLAAHPDDPPLPFIRQQPRLVHQPSLYQKLLDLHPSPANQMEFCVGSLAEMTEGEIHEVVEHYAATGRIGYVHLRNVRDKVPHYKETFIDDGEVDVLRVLRILHQHGYEGVVIPDHAPAMSCPAPWHAGMAFALGYLKAGIAVAKGGPH